MNNLIKNNWNNNNLKDFYDLLIKYKKDDRILWTTNIVNTKMNVLAVPSDITKEISKYIYKGNYLSFLDLMPSKYYEATIVDGYLISKIKDFNLQKKYILLFSKHIDNWASVDTLKYNIKGFEKQYLEFSKSLIKSKKTFERRIGVRILFSFTKFDEYIDEIYSIMDSLYSECEYYVNMANAWLFCEMFIKNRNKTLCYLKNHHLNKFTINKGISKCCDSFRVSNEDKLLLKKYIVK
ncbi:MAG: DNA alkylation repair protein [Bacilli bacterium]|nr:DNA alkylation repair protein [Bacilli bacterium]